MAEFQVSTYRYKKFLLPFITAAIAMLAGSLIFILPPPVATQFHETTAGKYLSISVAADITIELDANSAVTVTNSEPPKVELLQGNAYFEIQRKDVDTTKLEVILGDVLIRNQGTRFSLKKLKNGGRVAISKGQIEIYFGNQARLVNAGQQVDFDNAHITEESSIVGLDIATWRRNKN
tara:strand:- start:2736 stop:3269 length:534 start_codon:yes stop_codon:yes gene_type:complete